MHDRRRFWARAVLLGWQRVITLRDHIETAVVLVVFGLATLGISVRVGPWWLAPSLLAMALVALVLDSAYVQWRDMPAGHDTDDGLRSDVETGRVPKNRDQIVLALSALYRAYRRVVDELVSLHAKGITFSLETEEPSEEPQALALASEAVDEAREELETAIRMAGQGFRVQLRWVQSSLESDVLDVMFPEEDETPNFAWVYEEMAATVDRAIYRLDLGELYVESDYPGTTEVSFKP